MRVGIEAISFYTPPFYLPLQTLAELRGVNPDKYHTGIGQVKMSQAAPDEDIVTMAVKAARTALQSTDLKSIRTVLFATETGIDQAKSAGVYMHKLLGLSPACRVVELKQACYSATAALQLAKGQVMMEPNKKVLIIASDIAKYDLASPGEATQGAGAVAIVVGNDPKIIELENGSGIYTEDIHDFWRPNHRQTPLVDGKYSAWAYIHAIKTSWDDYHTTTERNFESHDFFCYHSPFTGMALKAHRQLQKHVTGSNDRSQMEKQVEPTLNYNRIIGNSYTAAMYIGLCSLLDNSQEDLTEKRIGFFSYGSGCVSEFFSAKILPEYKNFIHAPKHLKMLHDRREITVDEYLAWHNFEINGKSEVDIEQTTEGCCHFTGIKNHQRQYSLSL